MKTNRFLTIVLGLIATIAITSCVQDDDYTVPESLGDEENIGLNELLANSTPVTVAEAKSYFVPGEVTEITTDVYVKGYVSSSDRTGNFYKEFFIQDSPSNPTAAIKVVLNQVDSYNQFNFGREVYINLNGLVIGEVRSGDDVITIGGAGNNDNEVEQITGNRVPSKIFRSQVTETMEPLVVTFAQINDSHIGMYVMVENAHFPDTLEGEFYVDPFDDFDTSRTMLSCDGFGYTSFPLETSSFADFAQIPLPTDGGGTIAGVIAKTFNGSNLIMAINTTDDVKFDQTKCEPLDIDEFDIIFEEDFVGGLNGWDVITTEGTREWYATSFGGVSYVRGSAYNGSSGEPMISWLISPSFDFDAQEDEQMILEIADAFSDAGEEPLKAYYSNDYVAGTDPTTATWTEIGQAEIEALPINGGFFDNEYDVTGLIDLSDASGNGFIAFVYDSNSGAISSTRDLSNVKILAPQ